MFYREEKSKEYETNKKLFSTIITITIIGAQLLNHKLFDFQRTSFFDSRNLVTMIA
jgi:hypothetical protein